MNAGWSVRARRCLFWQAAQGAGGVISRTTVLCSMARNGGLIAMGLMVMIASLAIPYLVPEITTALVPPDSLALAFAWYCIIFWIGAIACATGLVLWWACRR